MLTRSGWLVALGAVATLVGGRLFGLAELFVVGGAMAVLPPAALGWVRLVEPRLGVERVVRPRHIQRGGSSRVDLHVVNRGHRLSPVLTLHDPVEGTRGVKLALARLAPESGRNASYRLPTGRRGRLRVGPLRAEVTDPFGLAQRRFVVAGTTSLTVFPTVESLAGLPSGAGRDDPLAGLVRHATGIGADDFSTLRPYVVGDDLRRVHWVCTARTGDLLVRQDDERWQGHVTLLVDGRLDHIGAEGFEAAVSAAASLVHAIGRAGDRVRLLGTDGTDSGSVDAHGAGEQLLEHLAVAARHRRGTLPVIPSDGRSLTGSLILLTGPSGSDVIALAADARRTFATVVVVRVVEEPTETWNPAPEPLPAGVELAVLGADEPFAPTWQTLLVRLAVGPR
ncbi:MAG: DUF58 domain-containing protein [Acidimicrobiales bacterium]